LQNLKSHLNLARDELLARPPPLALIKKHDGKVSEPTREQLRVVTLHASIPFVGELVDNQLQMILHNQFRSECSPFFYLMKGFGIMDNGILILAGKHLNDNCYTMSLKVRSFSILGVLTTEHFYCRR
jgi:hypothetical protein